MCCFLSPLEYVLFTLMSCFTVHLNTTSPIWLTLLLLWFIWDYIIPSNLVCMHVVIVLVATSPGSMDKFVIRKATSLGTKRTICWFSGLIWFRLWAATTREGCSNWIRQSVGLQGQAILHDYSLMANESTDIASQEELYISMCTLARAK